MLKFGFYEKEITPPLGCGIPGYFSLRRGKDVRDRLYARAAVIECGEERAAIISVDGLHPKADLIEAIVSRVEDYTGIAKERVTVAFTHSHTAIPFRFEGIAFGDDEIVKSSIVGYGEVFSRLVADCATLAALRLQPARAAFGKGEVAGISFCRDYYMKDGTPRTNPPRTSPDILRPVTEADRELPLLMVRAEDGTPLGALLGFACHADCIGGEAYSGDYISVLARELKRAYGEDFVTVFLLGCCGDVNHFDVSRASDAPDHYVMMGKALAAEVVRVEKEAKPLEKESLTVTVDTLPLDRYEVEPERIAAAREAVATIKEQKGVKISADNTAPDQYRLAMAKRLLSYLEETPKRQDTPLRCIQIGEVTIYGFHSEIFTEFGRLVKAGDGKESVMVATLCNAAYGYVPTRDMFCDTVYESRPGSCRLEKEAGYKMVEKLLSMKKPTP